MAGDNTKENSKPQIQRHLSVHFGIEANPLKSGKKELINTHK
jgi:hypothetical protein